MKVWFSSVARLTTEHDRTDVNVVLGLGRSVDNHGTDDSSRVLGRVMSVVPCRPIKTGEEFVSEAFPGCNGTLGDTGGTIFPWSSLLQETVPVNDRAFLGGCDVVVYFDDDLVAPIGLYQRPGKGAVDEQDIPLISIWGNDSTADGEIVGSDNSGPWPVSVRVGAPVGELAPGVSAGERVVGEKEGD